ncbi:Cna B-type domain-containing protein [Enterococcus gallinarum]|uniref:Cna B-type domain-containing protein n=3 Tax=Enterococcus gallinarum TaxID=1353 RepID=UPI00288F751B|nr:Cna B-type domain-containing protein [Enterococcus gallinarum]MDT2683728.1 Cna B-type domain-containing protein [Enterococcus gallinarum]
MKKFNNLKNKWSVLFVSLLLFSLIPITMTTSLADSNTNADSISNVRKKRSIIYPESEVVTFQFHFNDKVVSTQKLKINNVNEKLYEPTNIDGQIENSKDNATKVYDGWYYLVQDKKQKIDFSKPLDTNGLSGIVDCYPSYREKVRVQFILKEDSMNKVVESFDIGKATSLKENGISSINIDHILPSKKIIDSFEKENKQPFSFDDKLTRDTKVYISLADGIKVQYETLGGNLLSTDYIHLNKKINLPIPKKAGYEFLGWSKQNKVKENKEETEFLENKNAPIVDASDLNEDVTLYAVWKPVKTYYRINLLVESNNLTKDMLGKQILYEVHTLNNQDDLTHFKETNLSDEMKNKLSGRGAELSFTSDYNESNEEIRAYGKTFLDSNQFYDLIFEKRDDGTLNLGRATSNFPYGMNTNEQSFNSKLSTVKAYNTQEETNYGYELLNTMVENVLTGEEITIKNIESLIKEKLPSESEIDRNSFQTKRVKGDGSTSIDLKIKRKKKDVEFAFVSGKFIRSQKSPENLLLEGTPYDLFLKGDIITSIRYKNIPIGADTKVLWDKANELYQENFQKKVGKSFDLAPAWYMANTNKTNLPTSLAFSSPPKVIGNEATDAEKKAYDSPGVYIGPDKKINEEMLLILNESNSYLKNDRYRRKSSVQVVSRFYEIDNDKILPFDSKEAQTFYNDPENKALYEKNGEVILGNYSPSNSADNTQTLDGKKRTLIYSNKFEFNNNNIRIGSEDFATIPGFQVFNYGVFGRKTYTGTKFTREYKELSFYGTRDINSLPHSLTEYEQTVGFRQNNSVEEYPLDVYLKRLSYPLTFYFNDGSKRFEDDVKSETIYIPYEANIHEYLTNYFSNHSEEETKDVNHIRQALQWNKSTTAESTKNVSFSGWYKTTESNTENEFNFNQQMPYYGLNVNANWESQKIHVKIYQKGSQRTEEFDQEQGRIIDESKLVFEPENELENKNEFLGMQFREKVNGKWTEWKHYEKEYNLSHDTEIRSVWKNNGYHIFYDLNGGTSDQAIEDSTIYLSNQLGILQYPKNVKPPKDHKGNQQIFSHWELVENKDDKKDYLPYEDVVMNSDKYFRAIYKPLSKPTKVVYKANYDMNIEPDKEVEVVNNDSHELLANMFSRKDAVFLGWSRTSSGYTNEGAEELIQPGEKVTVDMVNEDNNVLYAIWGTRITVQKEWDYEDEEYPAISNFPQMKVSLYRTIDGEKEKVGETKEIPLPTDNEKDFEIDFGIQRKDKNGHPYKYEVVEEGENSNSNWTTEISGLVVKNSLLPQEKRGSLTLKKKVFLKDNEGNETEKTSDENFHFVLTGPFGYKKEINLKSDQQITIEHLLSGEYELKEINNSKYESYYKVDNEKETKDSSIVSITPTNSNRSLLVKNVMNIIPPTPLEPATIHIPVKKEWKGTVGSEATVVLKANGEVVKEAVLNEGNNWETDFTDLPVVKDIQDKEAIEYTVEEKGAENGEVTIDGKSYTVAVTGNAKEGYSIVNSEIIPPTPLEPATIHIPVKKEWKGTVGSEVTVLLKANGEVVKEAVLNEGNNWETDFTDLPVVKDIQDKEAIEYTVEEKGAENGEVTIDGKAYTVAVTGNTKEGYSIVNSEIKSINKKLPKTGEKGTAYLGLIGFIFIVASLIFLKKIQTKNTPK